MKLLTKAILEKLPALGAQIELEDPIVHIRYFMPTGSLTFFVTEGDQRSYDTIFYGWAEHCHDHHDDEFGHFTLADLESVTGMYGLGVERDRLFKPCPLSECSEEYRRSITRLQSKILV